MTDDRHDELGSAVSRMYATADPPPAHLLAAASALLSWRDPDLELAALLVDSAVAGEAAGIRSASDSPRMLSFAVGDVQLDVELVVDDGTVRLVGQVSSPEVAPIAVRHRDGTWTGTTDELGRFAVSGLPAAPLRITWGTPPVSSPTIML
ncbi:hypothetical protein [Dactylosporangium sp. CA-139066]|uniref:hypothetical protein n=1 Tax=Dactylosporangium sp. CA-139066 TaxID=3239930 RepID=UPI003D93E992